MRTQKFYLKATTSSAAAKKAFAAKFPQAKLVSFETKVASADEARAARAAVGELVYEATAKFSEFPPSGGGGGDEEAPEPKEPPADDAPDDGGDDGASDDGPPEFGTKDEGGDEGGGEKPKKMKPEEEMVHLLHQILDAISGGAGPGGPGGPDDGLGAPDLGGPPGGPPVGAGGPPNVGGPPTKAPLPPPVHPKAPMGGPAFSKVATAIRVEASQIGNKSLIAECDEIYPTHEVVQIRRSGVHTLEGKSYDAKKNDIAVVTLAPKPVQE